MRQHVARWDVHSAAALRTLQPPRVPGVTAFFSRDAEGEHCSRGKRLRRCGTMRELVRGRDVVAVLPLLMLLAFSSCHRTASAPASEQSGITVLEECDPAGYIP